MIQEVLQLREHCILHTKYKLGGSPPEWGIPANSWATYATLVYCSSPSTHPTRGSVSYSLDHCVDSDFRRQETPHGNRM